MTIEAAEPGLRERKRLATRRTIQLTAIDLVAERGLENVTVDEISRNSDVSPRTFFNYFTSKEQALIGDGPALPDEGAVAGFVASDGDVLTGIGELIAIASDQNQFEHELTLKRREVLRSYPHLFAIRMASLRHFEEDLTEIIARRLRMGEPALAGTELANRAKLLTLMATAAMKHAWTCWAEAPVEGELAARVRDSFRQMRHELASEIR